jgi:hypothetical protein
MHAGHMKHIGKPHATRGLRTPALRKGHRLMVFEIRILMRIFGLGEGINRRWRQIRNEELYNLNS